jgi:hypothetical protein
MPSTVAALRAILLVVGVFAIGSAVRALLAQAPQPATVPATCATAVDRARVDVLGHLSFDSRAYVRAPGGGCRSQVARGAAVSPTEALILVDCARGTDALDPGDWTCVVKHARTLRVENVTLICPLTPKESQPTYQYVDRAACRALVIAYASVYGVPSDDTYRLEGRDEITYRFLNARLIVESV